ncbi:MAG: hypothetical protein GF411_15610 [Candidatus Lokiarchaeota archaeon]|nr:hypothetical protein [Candidatus Lokiarchaeota archaeon]
MVIVIIFVIRWGIENEFLFYFLIVIFISGFVADRGMVFSQLHIKIQRKIVDYRSDLLFNNDYFSLSACTLYPPVLFR